MERSFITLVAAAATLSLGTSAFAQGRAEQAPSPPINGSQAVQVSDAELETFADIYVDLQETASKYEAEMATVETEEDARDVQTRMQEESVATVARRGWTPDQYVAVAQAINSDPTLAEKTRRMIDR